MTQRARTSSRRAANENGDGQSSPDGPTGASSAPARARRSQQLDATSSNDPVLLAEQQWAAAGWPAGPRLMAALSILRTEEIIRTDNQPVLKRHHLSHGRHAALALLYFSRNGELPLTKLSSHLMVHPTSITSTMDALERFGLAERVPHPTDRRTTLARITDRGRRAIEETSNAMGERQWSLGALTEEEAAQLVVLLRKVRVDRGDLAPGNGASEDVGATLRGR
jgi:DNA-binding MarR family transcriptional regulator